MEVLLRRRTAVVTLTLLLGCTFEAVQCLCSNASAQLDTLLAEYDREAAPNGKVTVQLSLEVSHATVREDTSAVRVLANFHLVWTDPRLSWNESDWGCDWFLTSAERLWLPDVALVNAAATTDSEEPLRARLSPAGAVQWARRLDVSLPVELQLEEWPADEQAAALKFASREHPIDEIDLEAQESLYPMIFEAGGWKIESLISAIVTLDEEWAEERRVVQWTLRLRRRAPAQELAARAALAGAALLLVAAALLPPAARTPLAAAAALVTALWLSSVTWRLSGSRSAPRCVRSGGALCALSGAAALCAAACARLARCRRPAPPALRTLLHAASKYWLIAPQPEGSGESGAWAGAARLLDAVLLLLLALTLLVLLALAF